MSVIFKEKSYDQLALLAKSAAVILIILLLFLFLINYYFHKQLRTLELELKNLREESFKYSTLLKSSEVDLTSVQNKAISFNLLKKLAFYAEGLYYNSIQLKNKRINITGFSSSQNKIFQLIKDLDNDSLFENSNLKNIQQRENLYFEIVAELSS